MTLTGICTLMMITTAVILFVDRTTEERKAQSTLKSKSKKIDIQETAATQVVAVFLFIFTTIFFQLSLLFSII